MVRWKRLLSGREQMWTRGCWTVKTCSVLTGTAASSEQSKRGMTSRFGAVGGATNHGSTVGETAAMREGERTTCIAVLGLVRRAEA
jgi:hypothetical protein